MCMDFNLFLCLTDPLIRVFRTCVLGRLGGTNVELGADYSELDVKLLYVPPSVNERFDSVKQFAQGFENRKMMITFIMIGTAGNDFVTGPKVPFTVVNHAKYLYR